MQSLKQNKQLNVSIWTTKLQVHSDINKELRKLKHKQFGILKR